MTLPKAVRFNTAVIFQEIDGSALLLDTVQGVYFGLDGVGLRIWELLQQGVLPAQIPAALADEYDAPLEMLATDLMEFLTELREVGLLEFA